MHKMKFGIRLQYVLYTFIVTLIISGLITTYAVIDKKSDSIHENTIKAQSLATILSETLVSPLYELKVDKMDRFISHTLSDLDITHVFVIDNEGYILTDGTENNNFRDEYITDLYPVLNNENGDNIYSLDDQQALLINKKITTASGQELGTVVIRTSLSRANKSVQNSTYNMFIISSAAIALGLLLSIIVANTQIKPIRKIKNATKKIAQGELHTRLSIHRNDELGGLAKAVDHMADQLLQTTVSKKYINKIIDTMPDGLIMLDEKGHITQANPYIDNLFNLQEGSLIGSDFEDIFSHVDQSPLTNDTNESDILINGVSYPVSISCTKMLNSTNENETLVIIHDIRKQKELEKEREQALIKAQESSQLKSEFLASMSHEIRTPMNGVLGMLQLLMRGDLSQQQQHYAAVARTSADTLLVLINDILDFSKIEAGKLELEIIDYNLRSHFEDIANTMAISAQEKGLELCLDISLISAQNVKGDPGRLGQILTNLVGNAIKFTRQGEIVIQASVTKTDSNSLALHCSITDTGIGIEEDKLDGLFESFTQVDASTTRKYGGTGLGLAIANKLCIQMGGKLEVASEVGNGSCFSFSIILLGSETEKIKLPSMDLINKSVLLVDDNRTNRNILHRLLESWGADVTEANNGLGALEILDQSPSAFDLALLDMQMPQMDGLTLGKEIQTRTSIADIKLILMTPINEANPGNLYTAGFSAYCTKPLTRTNIIESLTRAIEDKVNPDQGQSKITHEASPNVSPDLTSRQPSTTQYRILVVEDNIINQQVALGILEGFSLKADIANNGIEALSALNNAPQQAPYHLLLMDCQMPDMDGYEATRSIRSGKGGERYKNIPIVAMTANAMKGDKDLCLKAGMDDYISKPVEPESVSTKLYQWLPKDPLNTTNIKQQKSSPAMDIIKNSCSWDQTSFLQQVGKNPQRANKLLDMFFERTPALLVQLKIALASQSSSQKEITQTIQDSAQVLGGLQLASTARDIFLALDQDNRTQANKLFSRLEVEYAELETEMKHYKKHKKIY